MPNCAVYGCKSHNKMKGEFRVKFYSFPKNKDLTKQWSNACCRDKINMKHAVICSKHFESKCFFTPLKYKLLKETVPKSFRNLLDDAIPTLFLPKHSTTSTSSSSNTCSKRSRRMQKKDLENQKIMIAENVTDPNFNSTNGFNHPSEYNGQAVKEPTGPDSLTDKMNELKELQNMKIRMISMEKEIELLKSKSADLVKKNRVLDSKVSQYRAAMSNHFTPGQIKHLLNPNKKFSSWDSEDIASAISLRSVSPKAYSYLRKNGYPLPALNTLRKGGL